MKASAVSSEVATPDGGHYDEKDTFSPTHSLGRRSAEGFYYRPYDFILLDNVMPRMDGPTAASKIREMGFTGPIFGKNYLF
jgi:CheY-like chemotaxis protein